MKRRTYLSGAPVPKAFNGTSSAQQRSTGVLSRPCICKVFTCGSIECPSYFIAASFKRGATGFQGLHGTGWTSKNSTLSWVRPFSKTQRSKTTLARYSSAPSTHQREAFSKTLQPFLKSSFAKAALQAPALIVS